MDRRGCDRRAGISSRYPHVIIPMLYVQVLPSPALLRTVGITLTSPPRPAPPAPPPPPAARALTPRVVPRKFNPNALLAPRRIAQQIPAIVAAPAPAEGGVVGGVPGAVVGSGIGDLQSSLPNLPPPPPPVKKVAPVEPAAPQRIQVGGQVEAALLIHEVQPVYPLLARRAQIFGIVHMKAVIGKDGSVQDLTVMSGRPLLVPAAMEAVKQWRYQPTYLNGKPAKVSTEIDVRFTLSS
jgi:periplasmic protein TonB